MDSENQNYSGEYNTRVTLIQRLKEDDNSSDWKVFTEVYQKYLYVVVRNLGMSHHDSEEVVQSVFTKVWSRLPNFEYLPTKGRFRHWLCSIARNLAYDRMRSRNAVNRMKDGLKQEVVEPEKEHYASPELAYAVDKEWKNYLANKALEEAKNEFNELAINAFNLSVKTKSVGDIAVELNIAENTVYVYCKKVREFIKKRMAEMDNNWG